jgi:hypothetical protein
MELETAIALLPKLREFEELINEMATIVRAVKNSEERDQYILVLSGALIDITGEIALPLLDEFPELIELEEKS